MLAASQMPSVQARRDCRRSSRDTGDRFDSGLGRRPGTPVAPKLWADDPLPSLGARDRAGLSTSHRVISAHDDAAVGSELAIQLHARLPILVLLAWN